MGMRPRNSHNRKPTNNATMVMPLRKIMVGLLVHAPQRVYDAQARGLDGGNEATDRADE